MSIKLADWSYFLNFVGQRPMMQWMAERRRQHSHVMGGWMDVSPPLVIGARSANLAIALFDISANSASISRWQAGPPPWSGRGIGRADRRRSLRQSPFAPAVRSPTLISHFVMEQVGPLKAVELPPPDR
ncbi:hypothetical protein [Rhizobium leguminosarum]|uniref:hypothetical protein n=1 Tax=Rhizobium leguminosarum TaxID=384 RepID=UPI001C970AE8|nr:hypothetical protein [Rhizobium leguminosarum]MBY5325951.1 hypothetical protein [Rhizobium leguminosarum]